jgi:hypothetical protein
MRGTSAVLPNKPASAGLVTAGAIALGVLIVLAFVYVIYALWPRWPDVPLDADAPSLPIVIGDVLFQIPPAAIRQKMQRRAGAQERIDLAYLWPTLEPSAPTRANTMNPSLAAAPRIFLSITPAPTATTPAERLRVIYPRYLERNMWPGPPGLTVISFRTDTAYRGEDLFYDQQAPDRFVARCTRDNGPAAGSCLYERLVGSVNITVRFPRAWIDEWRSVLNAIDTIIERMQPSAH